MATPLGLPPPPARAPLPSGEVNVYQKLMSIELRIGNLEQAAAIGNAGTRNQTLQIIAGCVTAVVTAVAGARLTAPAPPPTQTIVVQSAFDRARESCVKLPAPENQIACLSQLLKDSVGQAH